MQSIPRISKAVCDHFVRQTPAVPAPSPEVSSLRRWLPLRTVAGFRRPTRTSDDGVTAVHRVYARSERRVWSLASGIATGSWSTRPTWHQRATVQRPTQFNLRELFVLVLVAALSCAIATRMSVPMGSLFFLNVVALRVAATDFTWRGEAAMVVAVLSGVLCILLVVCSSLVPI